MPRFQKHRHKSRETEVWQGHDASKALAFRSTGLRFKWEDAEKWVAKIHQGSNSMHDVFQPQISTLVRSRAGATSVAEVYDAAHEDHCAWQSDSAWRYPETGSLSLKGAFGVETHTHVHGRVAAMKEAGTEVSGLVLTGDMAPEMNPLPNSHVSLARGVSSPAHVNNSGGEKTVHYVRSCSINKQKPGALELTESGGLPDGSHFLSPAMITPSWSHQSVDEDALEVSRSGVTSCGATAETDEDGMSPDESGRAWDERAQCYARYNCEEARIEAWENLQVAKAEAELKKLEAKLEKVKCRATEKIMGKLFAARKRAQGMRATVEAQQEGADVNVRVGDGQWKCVHSSVYFPGRFRVCFAGII